jgi:hypothetical protein
MKDLKNVNYEGFEELSTEESREIEGGFITLIITGIGVCIAAYGIGLATGRAIF